MSMSERNTGHGMGELKLEHGPLFKVNGRKILHRNTDTLTIKLILHCELQDGERQEEKERSGEERSEGSEAGTKDLKTVSPSIIC